MVFIVKFELRLDLKYIFFINNIFSVIYIKFIKLTFATTAYKISEDL
jgi:hypothetical protein